MSKVGNIQLASGRTIRLRSIKQRQEYAGLLEGLPTREMNKRSIDAVLAEVRRTDGCEPYLVQPMEKAIEYLKGERYPFGEPAALPAIGCIGRFTCLEPARDSSKDYSSLTVIWFQEDFAFPIEAGVLEQIRMLDWTRYALDYEY